MKAKRTVHVITEASMATAIIRAKPVTLGKVSPLLLDQIKRPGKRRMRKKTMRKRRRKKNLTRVFILQMKLHPLLRIKTTLIPELLIQMAEPRVLGVKRTLTLSQKDHSTAISDTH